MKNIFCSMLVVMALSPLSLYADNINSPGNVMQFNYHLSIHAPNLQEAQNAVRTAIATPFAIAGNWYSWIMENKCMSLVYGTGAFYIAVNAYLLYLQKRLQAMDNWSLWNKQLSLEELGAMGPQALAEALLHEVQERYTTINALEDFSEPLVTFLKAVEVEENLLHAYNRLCSLCKRAGIAKVMWIDEQVHASYVARLKRLVYLKSIFGHWMASYKIDKQTRMYGYVQK